MSYLDELGIELNHQERAYLEYCNRTQKRWCADEEDRQEWGPCCNWPKPDTTRPVTHVRFSAYEERPSRCDDWRQIGYDKHTSHTNTGSAIRQICFEGKTKRCKLSD